MGQNLVEWQWRNLAIIEEALAEALILRVILRIGGEREVVVGLPRTVGFGVLVIRDLADRRRRRLYLSEISVVEVVGVYLEDYEVDLSLSRGG